MFICIKQNNNNSNNNDNNDNKTAIILQVYMAFTDKLSWFPYDKDIEAKTTSPRSGSLEPSAELTSSLELHF